MFNSLRFGRRCLWLARSNQAGCRAGLSGCLVQTQEYKRHWSPLNAKEIVVADNKTAQQFATLVQQMLIEQATLRKVTRNLRRTRDLLLPRLLSGQLDMEALDLA